MLAHFPRGRGLAVIFGYWGLTSILFYLAAIIKATREWGGRPLFLGLVLAQKGVYTSYTRE